MNFLTKLANGIRTGNGGPRVLSDFALEHEIYKRLGQTWDQFVERPWKQVEDYILIIQMICREEDAQNRRRNRGH